MPPCLENRVVSFFSNSDNPPNWVRWGVKAFFYDKDLSTDDTIADINQIVKSKGFVSKGDFIINLTSMPVEEKGMVNTLRISEIN